MTRDFRHWWTDDDGDVGGNVPRRPSPGKVTLTQSIPVQRRARPDARATRRSQSAEPFGFVQAYAGEIKEQATASFPDETPVSWLAAEANDACRAAFDFDYKPVQRAAAATADGDTATIHAAASKGLESPSQQLPHLDRIQDSFGKHDVSHVQAHVGGAAAEASAAIGAEAYATGDHVAFERAPDLHTAAHEAAHVVQQQGGVQLKGGVGEAGDSYERHADAVADKVVAGESAESLLDKVAGSGTGFSAGLVQRKNIGGTGDGKEETSSDVSADRFRFEAERRGTLVTAREYLRGYMMTKIGPALQTAMADKGYPVPHPRLSWGEKASNFGYEVVTRIPDVFNDDYHGLPELLGEEIWALVDANRMRSTDDRTIADKVVPGIPKEGMKDGIRGPMRWVPDVGVAIADRFDERIRASLPRVGQRYVEAFERLVAEASDGQHRAVKSSDILPGHPMDRLVIRVVCTEGVVAIAPRHDDHHAGASAKKPKGPRRLKSLTWVDEPGMWNWVKVSPPDATAEEVAYHLFKDYSAAHRLVATPPFFGLTIKDAAQFPEARAMRAKHAGGNAFDAMDAAANESPDLTRARAEQTQDPAHDPHAQLVNSKTGEDAARAQGVRTASHASDPEAATADAAKTHGSTDPVEAFAAVISQLEAMARMVAAFGLARAQTRAFIRPVGKVTDEGTTRLAATFSRTFSADPEIFPRI